MGFPESNDEEKAARHKAIQDATKYAIEIPFRVMQKSFESLALLKAMAETGLQSSVSDAGVGAHCIRTAVYGAYLNIKINAGDLEDKAYLEKLFKEAEEIYNKTTELEKEIVDIVNSKL